MDGSSGVVELRRALTEPVWGGSVSARSAKRTQNVAGAGGVELEERLRSVGEVFAAFREQDSGSVSFGVEVDGQRLFVKVAREPRAVPSLERAAAFHRDVHHPAIIPLLGDLVIPGGRVLVHPWVDGEVLYGAPGGGRRARTRPDGPHARFRRLPLREVLAAVGRIFDAHLEVAERGYVAVDLYDGCFIYDFGRREMQLCDLDEYRPGPFVLSDDRLPGSRRFMAPEEWRRGATIDERTMVHALGRTALVLLDDGDLDGRFRGSVEAQAVAQRASRADPGERYPSVVALVEAWTEAAAR